MYKNHETGTLGENIATKYLIKQGYDIYERNFRCKLGEIDIIAIDKIDKNELVFIEVKTRMQDLYGRPSEAVDDRKAKHLYKAAEVFLMVHKLEKAFVRFDVIEIIECSSHQFKINHIKNAILDTPNKNTVFS